MNVGKVKGAMGSGIKKHPGEPSGGMSNNKCTVSIPKASVPSGAGQTAGTVNHQNMSSNKKVESLSGFPGKR